MQTGVEAFGRARTSAAIASNFIGEVPCHSRWLVSMMADDGLDVVLVCSLDLRGGIENAMPLTTADDLFAAEIHSTVISSVKLLTRDKSNKCRLGHHCVEFPQPSQACFD
jgi:hypothetical protein